MDEINVTAKPDFPPNLIVREQAAQESNANPEKSVTVRREIDRLARQTEGISKALKRLKDTV